ncbi:MAG: hypothetical protein ACLGGV_01820 [Bacteroidia bacterium]
MKTLLSLSFALGLCFGAFSQKYEYLAGARLGASNSFTDIGGQKSGAMIDMNIEGTRFVASGTFETRFKSFYSLSADLTLSKLHGSDEYAKVEGKRIRNVRFNTPVFEIAVLNNFNMFEVFSYKKKYFVYPSLSLGFSLVHFNPKAADGTNTELQPLGTAGQKVPTYDFSPYSKWTTAILYQIGAETKEISKGTFSGFSFGFALTYHQTFTDYLDDTGHDLYVNPDLIKEHSGEVASYYSQPGQQHAWHRGGKKNDVFTTARFSIKKRLNSVKVDNQFF